MKSLRCALPPEDNSISFFSNVLTELIAMSKKLIRLAVLVLSSVLLSVPVRAQDLTIAAAADLRSTLDEIAARFQADAGAHIKLIYGSSGNFYQQIQNGAPFDLFLSANAEYPKKLESAGLALPGSYYEYARGKLVLLVPANSKLELSKGLSVLLGAEVKKIAIADPSHAPYGQAAVAALKAEKIYETISPKIVTGENVSQAASFVLSGAADVGIVALSLAVSSADSKVRYSEVPARDYPPIQQACIVLRSSKNQNLAMRFESYLRDEKAAEVFQRFGFEVPGRASAEPW
jgi:molybdate transport system substrate-binding protein